MRVLGRSAVFRRAMAGAARRSRRSRRRGGRRSSSTRSRSSRLIRRRAKPASPSRRAIRAWATPCPGCAPASARWRRRAARASSTAPSCSTCWPRASRRRRRSIDSWRPMPIASAVRWASSASTADRRSGPGTGQKGAESRGDWTAEASGPTFAVQGNSLVSPDVVKAVAAAFQASEGSPRHLADRLIEALERRATARRRRPPRRNAIGRRARRRSAAGDVAPPGRPDRQHQRLRASRAGARAAPHLRHGQRDARLPHARAVRLAAMCCS